MPPVRATTAEELIEEDRREWSVNAFGVALEDAVDEDDRYRRVDE